MGKTDNIKRAKKLKEAKRKREQDALIASGQGPAAKEIKKRVEQMGGMVMMNKGPVKYSELFKAFVTPMLDKEDNLEFVKSKFMFAQHAWNCAVIKETNKERFLTLKNEFSDMFSKLPESEELFDNLLERKQEEFADYKNLIANFEIKKIRGNDFDLTVATVPYKSAK